MQTSESGEPTVTSDLAEDWKASLPEGLVDAPFIKAAATLEQARSELDNAAFWKGNSILKPGANASDEAKAENLARVRELYPNLVEIPEAGSEEYGEFFAKIGKPEAADGYVPPEGAVIGEDEMAQLREVAHKANWTQSQFKAYIEQISTSRADANAASKQALDAELAALNKEWGATYEARMGEVAAFVAADPEVPAYIRNALDAGTLDAASIKWIHKLVSLGDEATPGSVQEKQAESGMTPAEGSARANEIRERMYGMRNTDPQWTFLYNELIKAERYASAGH